MYFCSALFPFRIVTTQREGRGVGSTHNGKERDFAIENPLSIKFLTLEYLASRTLKVVIFIHPSLSAGVGIIHAFFVLAFESSFSSSMFLYTSFSLSQVNVIVRQVALLFFLLLTLCQNLLIESIVKDESG